MTATAAPLAVSSDRRTGLRALAWVLQVLFGVAFIAAGAMKGFSPIADLHAKMAWATSWPDPVIRFIGISELLGGIGLILPSLTRIKPVLTPVAGFALAFVMVLAAGVHAMRAEWGGIGVNAVLGAGTFAAGWLRLKVVPIAPR